MGQFPVGRFVVVMSTLIIVGFISAGYVLLHQRAPVPFQKTYAVNVELSAADGVAPGLGQPVQVSGVRVGAITGSRVQDGNARVTLTIERRQLPRVYRNARADLAPITPLKDMRIDLDPGTDAAAALPDGGTIPIGRTQSPVPLSDLLSTLDGDTRAFLQSMAVSLGQGTDGRGRSIRQALRALGPTTTQVRGLTNALTGRRTEIAHLVHNLGIVTRAATQDQDLAAVVQAGNTTLRAIAGQDEPLRAALTRLPGTLRLTRQTLPSVAAFADELTPTVKALTPALRRLPGTFKALTPFARTTTTALAEDIRPFAREAQPVLRDLQPAISSLKAQAPDLTATLRTLNYTTNELGYNPPGDDEGFLFWGSWFFHNWNSLFSTEDAHGGIGRAMVMVDCNQFSGLVSLGPILKLATGTANLCKDG